MRFLNEHPASNEAVQARAALRDAHDDLAWKEAERIGTITAYKEYTKNYREGAHKSDANSRIDDLVWEAAKHVGTVDAYWDYLITKNGAHAADARARIDRITYDTASQRNSIGGLIDYIRVSREGSLSGEFVDQAQTRLKELLPRAVVVSDAGLAYVIERIEKLAAPFNLRELYDACTKERGPGIHTAVSTMSKPQPGKSPVISTVVQVLVGKRVVVAHLEGTIDQSTSKFVFALRNPLTNRSGDIGFEDIEIATAGENSQRYILVEKKWYRVD
jgi:hypothetical protein